MDRQSDRQTGRQTDDGQTGRQTDRQTDSHRQKDGQTDRYTVQTDEFYYFSSFGILLLSNAMSSSSFNSNIL